MNEKNTKNLWGKISESQILLMTFLCYILGFFILNAHLSKYGIFEIQSLLAYTRAAICTFIFLFPLILIYILLPYAKEIRIKIFEDLFNDKISEKLRDFLQGLINVILILSFLSLAIFGYLLIIVGLSFGIYEEISLQEICQLALLFCVIFCLILSLLINIENQVIIRIILLGFLAVGSLVFSKKIYQYIPLQIGGGLYPYKKQFVIKPEKIKDIDSFYFEVDRDCFLTDTLETIYENESKIYVKNMYGKVIGINKEIFNGEIIVDASGK